MENYTTCSPIFLFIVINLDILFKRSIRRNFTSLNPLKYKYTFFLILLVRVFKQYFK